MTDEHEIGVWKRHDGGKSPVPIGTIVDIMWCDKTRAGISEGRENTDSGVKIAWGNVTAYCVVKLAPVTVTRTGDCWAYHYNGSPPGLCTQELGDKCVLGTYSATTVDGRPTRIVWEADVLKADQ